MTVAAEFRPSAASLPQVAITAYQLHQLLTP